MPRQSVPRQCPLADTTPWPPGAGTLQAAGRAAHTRDEPPSHTATQSPIGGFRRGPQRPPIYFYGLPIYDYAAFHTARRRGRMPSAAGRYLTLILIVTPPLPLPLTRCHATAAPRLDSRLAPLSHRWRRGAGLRSDIWSGLRRLLRASAEQGSFALRPPARLQDPNPNLNPNPIP